MAAPLVGRRVLLQNIQSRPELVGQSGIAVSFKPDTGRYVVELSSGESVALRPSSVVANDDGGPDVRGAAPTGPFGLGNQFGEGGAVRIALAVASAAIFLLGLPALSTIFLVGVGYFAYSALYAPAINGGNLGVRGNLLERICFALQRATGVMVTPKHLGLGVAAVLGIYWYFYHGPGSDYGYGGYGGYDDGYGYGYGGGGGGGGFSFYWLFSAAMLGSYLWRMGGGGRPGGWSFNELWNSLSNMDLWQGMMLMNLVQRVMAGGGRRGGMGFGRRMYY